MNHGRNATICAATCEGRARWVWEDGVGRKDEITIPLRIVSGDFGNATGHFANVPSEVIMLKISKCVPFENVRELEVWARLV